MPKQDLPPVVGDIMGSLPVASRMQFNVNFNVSDSLAKRLEGLFPAYKFVASHWSSSESLHPILHCERLVKEHEAIKLTSGFVVDVGGNPQRHFKLGRTKVWSMCPVLTAADNHRASKNENSLAIMYCRHVAPECSVECACSEADSWLMVDSLYYFNPDQVNIMVQKADLIAVVHDFSNEVGDYYGEARYEVLADGTVSMVVNGSSIAYQHSALPWLRQASCYWDDCTGTGMSWYMIKTVGTSIIYRFVKLDQKVTSDPMPLAVALTNESSYCAPVSLTQAQCVGIVDDVGPMVLPWGSVVMVRRGTRTFRVPKRTVAIARMACAFMPRNSDVFQMVARKVKEYVERDSAVPLAEKPEVVVLATALGFTADIELEIAALNAVAGALQAPAAAHGNYLAFRQRTPRWYSPVSLVWAASAFIQRLLAGGASVVMPYVQARDHGSLVYGGPVGCVTLPGYESQRAYLPLPSSSHFQYSFKWKKFREKGAQLCGIGIASCLPVVSSDTPNNEERAIIHRALIPKFRVDGGLWSQVKEALDTLVPTRVVRATPFEVWNARFPRARALAHVRAKESFESCPDKDSVRRACIRKTFVKREKLLKSGVHGIEDFDPRVIQGTGDLANVLLGPWMHSFSKYLASVWTVHDRVTYASGLNSEGIGAWMDECLTIGYTWFLETDYARYDVSLCREALVVEQSVYRRCCAGKWAELVLEEQLLVRGRSSHGHQYRIEGTRCSGDPNTSCGNTMLSVGAISCALAEQGLFDFRVIAVGDDSVVAVHSPVDVEAFTFFLSTLGLSAKTKLHDDPDLVEFCSGRFWNSTSGRVWGPKIGRSLAKMGYAVSEQHNPLAWLKGVLIGVKQDVAHVPILNTYVGHCLDLVKSVRAQTTGDGHKFHVGRSHKPSDDTYNQFYKLYGLDPASLDSLKAYILAIDRLPFLMDHPVLDALMAVDV